MVERMIDGGVDLIQLRAKSMSRDEIATVAATLHQITVKRNIALVINDHPEIARVVGAEGVHVGQDDLSIGQAREITDTTEKLAAFNAFNEHFLPGHAAHALPLTAADLDAACLVAVPIREASAKIRTGGPARDADDPTRWSGEIPLHTVAGPPVSAPSCAASPPPTIVNFHRPGISGTGFLPV